MFHNFISYYKVHRDLVIQSMILAFIILVAAILFSAGQLSKQNIGVVFILFAPLMGMGIFARIFSFDYESNFDEMVKSYGGAQYKIFFYKYLLGSLLFLFPVLYSLIAFLLHPSRGTYDIYPDLLAMLSAAWLLINLTILFVIIAKKFALGLLGGFLLFLALIRVPLPPLAYNLVFPLLAIILGFSSLVLYLRRD